MNTGVEREMREVSVANAFQAGTTATAEIARQSIATERRIRRVPKSRFVFRRRLNWDAWKKEDTNALFR